MNPILEAFDFIATFLRRGGQREALARRLASETMRWDVVLRLARSEQIEPALWATLRDRGLTDRLSESLRDELFEAHLRSFRHNAQLRSRCDIALTALSAVGIDPVLLGGAAELYTHTLDDPGALTIHHMHLLVPQSERQRAMRVVAEVEATSTPQQAEADRSSASLAIVIQDRIVPQIEDLATERAITDISESIEVANMRVLTLTPTYRALQNVAYAQLMDRRHERGVVSLQHIYALCLLEYRYRARINWDDIAKLMKDRRRSGVLQDHLYLANAVLGMPFPAGIHASWHSGLHYRRCRLRLRRNAAMLRDAETS